MKIIVCSGDSHTCGQGAVGFFGEDSSRAVYHVDGKGFGRYSRFTCESYVEQVRRFVNGYTGSSSTEVEYDSIAKWYGFDTEFGNAIVDKTLKIRNNADLVLLLFAEQTTPAEVSIYLDGELYKTEKLYAEKTRFGDYSFRFIPVHCSGVKDIEVRPTAGKVLLSRIEYHSGEYAVVNAGIGSCTTVRFLNDFFDYCIDAFSPEIILAEAHTINDWITGCTPDEYEANLRKLLHRMKSVTDKTMMITVAPILDPQTINGSKEYIEYINASKAAAEKENVTLIDAHKSFSDMMSNMTADEQFEKLFSDRWHVNTYGHSIYADCIIDKLKGALQ